MVQEMVRHGLAPKEFWSTPQRKRHTLQVQAGLIRNTFAGRGIAVRIYASHVDSRSTRFVVEGAGTVQDKSDLEGALRRNLNCSGLQCTWWRENLVIEIPSWPEPSTNLFDLLERVPLPPFVAALGWSQEARPVLLNFAAEDVGHVLLCADTGAGKTSLMRTCAVSLALGSRQSQIQMLFIDPRLRGNTGTGICLGPMHYLPHALYRTVSRVERIVRLLAFLVGEWRKRRRSGVVVPRIIVFVDQLGSLLSEGGTAIEEPLQLLLGQGASSGIHLVMSAGVSDGRDLDQVLALKPLLRLYGWSRESEATRAALYREVLPAGGLRGKGDFVAAPGEAGVRFQAAYLDNYDLHFCLENLQRRRPPPIVARPAATRLALPRPPGPGRTSPIALSQMTVTPALLR